MPIDIWYYKRRQSWCADIPTKDGRKRLYLGPDKHKARAELHRQLAKHYDDLGSEGDDSRPVVRRRGDPISLVELAVRFLKWNKTNRAEGTCRSYRDGLKHVTRRYQTKLAASVSNCYHPGAERGMSS